MGALLVLALVALFLLVSLAGELHTTKKAPAARQTLRGHDGGAISDDHTV